MDEIKNIKKASERIKLAIKKKEKIILYGDADLDGSTSVIILQDAIKTLGGKVKLVYFPDRETQGYGINFSALEDLKVEAPALLIALDCGIGNFEEIKLANSLGFEVMVIDHHQILDKLPEASIIVDPKQPGDLYPFKDFSAAGVVFKLVEVLLGDRMTSSQRENFLELVALSTIADMMPQKSENKIFIEEGIRYLENSWRPGIRAFLEAEEFQEYSDIKQKIGFLISILNVRDVESNLPASFRLLVCTSAHEAQELIKVLLEKVKIRKDKIREVEEEIERRLIDSNKDPIIFEGGETFDLSLISTVASILCGRYAKPVFLFKIMEKESHGTVRSTKDINVVNLMKGCADLLITYGGHPPAAGFRLENDNLEKFKECLIKGVRKIKA